jgi:hypothetical protein
MDKSNDKKFRNLIETIRCFAVHNFIKHYTSVGSILVKLGLIIVLITHLYNPTPNLLEGLQLLVMTIGNLYPTVPREIKIMILKILMELYKSRK